MQKTAKIFSVTLAVLLLLTLPLAAMAAVVKPTSQFYVYDGADVLSAETENLIVENNAALYDACGAQLVFVTLDSTGSMDISDYAYKLFNDWGIGSQKNNGVLILMEIGAEDYWYVQGSGIERSLSTADLADLVDTYLEPDFARRDYDAGARKMFKALFEKVAAIYNADVPYSANPSSSTGVTTYAVAESGQEKEEESLSLAGLLGRIILILVLIAWCRSRIRRRRIHRPPRRTARFYGSTKPFGGRSGAGSPPYGGGKPTGSSFGSRPTGSRPTGSSFSSRPTGSSFSSRSTGSSFSSRSTGSRSTGSSFGGSSRSHSGGGGSTRGGGGGRHR